MSCVLEISVTGPNLRDAAQMKRSAQGEKATNVKKKTSGKFGWVATALPRVGGGSNAKRKRPGFIHSKWMINNHSAH